MSLYNEISKIRTESTLALEVLNGIDSYEASFNRWRQTQEGSRLASPLTPAQAAAEIDLLHNSMKSLVSATRHVATALQEIETHLRQLSNAAPSGMGRS